METIEEEKAEEMAYEIQCNQEYLEGSLEALGVFKRSEQVFKDHDIEAKLEAVRTKAAELAKDFNELHDIIKEATVKANPSNKMFLFNGWFAQTAGQFNEAKEAMEKPINALDNTLKRYPQYYKDINAQITQTRQQLNRMQEAPY